MSLPVRIAPLRVQRSLARRARRQLVQHSRPPPRPGPGARWLPFTSAAISSTVLMRLASTIAAFSFVFSLELL
jgi:hypothetical protein